MCRDHDQSNRPSTIAIGDHGMMSVFVPSGINNTSPEDGSINGADIRYQALEKDIPTGGLDGTGSLRRHTQGGSLISTAKSLADM